MTKLSRRHLVAGGLAGAGASVLPGFIGEANAATATRYNLASANGQVMLKKYAEAVKLMMALPPKDPLSWNFQWYTHAVPTNTTKAAALTQIYGPNPSPDKTLATAMWNTCQGHFSAAEEPYFLPWHRMYVCAFEEIIRGVLKDPKFTLPYWNYSVPAGYPLPKEFRLQNDPVWGSLFRPNRNSTSNAGAPIFTGRGSASNLDPASALAQPNYLPTGVVPGFNQALDQGVHGSVHVFVGNETNGMGVIPWAADDPIFWMHHCNIDRVWASWNAAGHGNPMTTAWLNKEFVFANPDGKGFKLVVKDFTNTKKCDYAYDQLISSPAQVASAANVLAAAAPPVAVTVAKSSAGPVALGAGPVRVDVKSATPPPAGAAQAVAPLSARLSALPESHKLYLVINDIKADAQPGTLYHVYLDLPEGPAPSDPFNSNYVGSFNFFDAVPHGDDHSQHASKPISFDITSVASNLDARGLLKPDHTVTIVPAIAPAEGAKPVVGDISFVEQ